MNIEIDYYNDFEDKDNLKKYENCFEKYKERIEKIAELALVDKNILAGSFYIGLGFVSKESIKKSNNEFRKIDKVTDVLSFPMYEKDEINILSEKNLSDETGQMPLGDIVVCLEKVEEQGLEYGTGFDRELLYMITHGMCHLMGYDHEDSIDKATMREKEELILKEIGGNN